MLVFDVFVKSSNILEIQADELFNIGLIHSRLDQFRRLMCFKLAETYFQTSKSFLILNLKKEMLLQFWISQEFCELVKLFRFSKKYYFLLWKNYIKDNISALEKFQEFVNAILKRHIGSLKSCFIENTFIWKSVSKQFVMVLIENKFNTKLSSVKAFRNNVPWTESK